MSYVHDLQEARKERLARIASKAIVKEQPKPEPEEAPARTPDKVMDAIATVEEWVRRQKSRFSEPDFPSNGVSIERIQSAVCQHYGLTISEIMSSRRNAVVSFPRQVAIHLCRRLTTRSFPEIARRFNGRDHTTALHADRKIARLLQTDITLRASVEMLIEKLGGEK